jgi:hypothetical protein
MNQIRTHSHVNLFYFRGSAQSDFFINHLTLTFANKLFIVNKLRPRQVQQNPRKLRPVINVTTLGTRITVLIGLSDRYYVHLAYEIPCYVPG